MRENQNTAEGLLPHLPPSACPQLAQRRPALLSPAST
jgi:hypothetical protein